MEGKKISFGFMKTKKAEKPVVEEKKDFIECVEEQSIKVLGGEETEQKALLVIPLKPNTLITAERLQKIADEVEGSVKDVEIKDEQLNNQKAPENETLDQMAERELLEAATRISEQKSSEILTVSLPREPPLDGQKESTLDDYENVPIREFGKAMLRGMGWKPDKDQTKYKEPQLRPKGLGLGADKVIKQKPKLGKDEEELMIVKNAFVKITTGKYSGYYGKVLSLDEDNGRVLVDVAVKKESVSLSEFMLHAVSKAEFDRESRVINADKFDEYKRKEEKPQKSTRENDSPSTGRREDNRPSDNRRRNGSPEVPRRRYSSNDSLSSSDDGTRRRKDKDSGSSDDSRSRRKHKKHRKGSPKRDIDKKRKGKKKKRDRDRSPNYRKHRK